MEARFAVLLRDAEISRLQALLDSDLSDSERRELDREYQSRCHQIRDDLKFLQKTNIGGEFLSEQDIARLAELSKTRWTDVNGEVQPLITEDELNNLSIRRGTLNDDEREIINNHIVATIKMLESLPFPRNLQNVPEYAGGHHEKMDGTGYPRGLKGEEMSVQARIMAIADIFEALTASDRPYKSGKKLSECLKIMSFMKRDQHIDSDIFEVFIKNKVYLDYADEFLDPEQIDAIDEKAVLQAT